MVLLFEVFPHIPLDMHMPTYYAVMRLILGVADNRTSLKSFLSHIGVCVCVHVWTQYVKYYTSLAVYQGLIRTCSHPVVIEVVSCACMYNIHTCTCISVCMCTVYIHVVLFVGNAWCCIVSSRMMAVWWWL